MNEREELFARFIECARLIGWNVSRQRDAMGTLYVDLADIHDPSRISAKSCIALWLSVDLPARDAPAYDAMLDWLESNDLPVRVGSAVTDVGMPIKGSYTCETWDEADSLWNQSDCHPTRAYAVTEAFCFCVEAKYTPPVTLASLAREEIEARR